MIQFLTLLCSLCIQFAAVDFPINYSVVNDSYASLTNTLYNDIQNRGFTFDKKYMVVVGDVVQGNGGGYECFVPLEVLNGSNSSNSVTYRIVYTDNNISLNVSTPGWVRFKYGTSLNFLFGGYNEGSSNFSAQILNPNDSIPNYFTNGLLYDEYYSFSYQGIDTISWDVPSNPVVSFDGHATGWSDLLIEDENGNVYTSLGHSLTFDDDALDFLNSYWSQHSKDDFYSSMLALNNRILSGISDSLSFGLGIIGKDIDDLKSWCDGFLSVFGISIDDLVDKMLEISGVATDINDNLEGYIDYVSEPFDASEWDLLMSTGNIGEFSSLAHSIEQMTTDRTDAQHIYISWNFGNVQYFGGASGRVDMAQYLNSSKSVWQPFILTFLYAAIIWQFVKSLPNLLQGASSSVNTETRNSKNP